MLLVEQIAEFEGRFRVSPTFSGGGRGWTASASGVSAKSISRSEALTALAAEMPKVIGGECLCGCGGFTKRRFVPGHDAIYHLQQAAKANGFATVADYRVHLRDESKKRAAAKRRSKRAAIKAGAAKIAAAAESGTLVTGSKPVGIPVAGAIVIDDLGF